MAMAVEENAGGGGGGGGSPRISFSHDLYLCDVVPIEQRPPRSRSKNSSLEFNFCVGAAAHDSFPADQLFSDGKLLPKEIINNKNRSTINNDAAPSDANAAAAAAFDNSSSADLGYSRIARDETGEDDPEKAQGGSKSFWRFGRSSSLNCGSSYGRALCPLPPLLSRSNSTGSASTKEKLKHGRPAARPPINKNAGVRVPPVLNVPSSNLFGLTSIFLNARDKRRRK